jgi:hypothetical protein
MAIMPSSRIALQRISVSVSCAWNQSSGPGFGAGTRSVRRRATFPLWGRYMPGFHLAQWISPARVMYHTWLRGLLLSKGGRGGL